MVGTTNRSMAAMSGAWLRRKVRHPWDGGPLQSSSASRFTAGASRFLNFSQSGERTAWSAKCYMNMRPLYQPQFAQTEAVALIKCAKDSGHYRKRKSPAIARLSYGSDHAPNRAWPRRLQAHHRLQRLRRRLD